MTLPALGAYAATTAGYFKLAHAYLPRRAVLFQGSAIAISGLMQANLPTTQSLVMKGVDRATAQYSLHLSPLILIGGVGILGGVPWRINILATLLFSALHLGIAKYVSHKTYINPTIRKAKELLSEFKKDPVENYQALETLKKMRREAVFMCVAGDLKDIYFEGVIHFCQNLPQNRELAKERYLALDPTIFRVRKDRAFYKKLLVEELVLAAAELEVAQPWPGRFNTKGVKKQELINFLRRSLNPKVGPILQQLGGSFDYYYFLWKTAGKERARAYLGNIKEEHGIEVELLDLFEAAFRGGDKETAFEYLIEKIKEMQAEKSPFQILPYVWLFKKGVGSEFFQEFQSQVPEECKTIFDNTLISLKNYEESQKAAVPLG